MTPQSPATTDSDGNRAGEVTRRLGSRSHPKRERRWDVRLWSYYGIQLTMGRAVVIALGAQDHERI